MTGIPSIQFDYFDLAEIPTFILCNPNKERLYALGGISERKYSPRYNSLSELSFRADEYVNEEQMQYYQYLVNKRLIYVDNIGYFLITEVNESNDGIVKYKEVECQSLEAELSFRKLTSFVSGSGIYDEQGNLVSTNPVPLTLSQLYTEILPYLSRWTFDIIPASIDTKYRSFDISDTTIYNLLMAEIEEAYECVFDFDTVNNLIYIHDANESVEITDIYISHDNVIKSMSKEEITDELATCLYVKGGGDLGINYVNPMGNNYIYNFQYFKNSNWMNEELIDAITLWEDKVLSASPLYSAEILAYFNDYDDYTEYSTQLTITSNSALYNSRLYDSLIASGCSTSDPYMLTLFNATMDLYVAGSALEAQMMVINGYIEDHLDTINEIADSLKLDNTDNFSTSQQLQLQPFIVQSSYINDNIILIDNMTSASILMQQESLYNQAVTILNKISMPRYNFEIDSVSFLQIKELNTIASQLELGKKITLEIEPGLYLQPILLGADIDFDDPINFKLIFGNRLRLNDESFQFNDLMNKALNAGTTINLNSQSFNNWTRDYKSGYLNLTSGVSVANPEPAEGIDVNPGSINLVTRNLLWNGVPLALGWATGGTAISNIKITLFSGGVSIAMYDPTEAGLNAAISMASTGDVIFMPDVDIEGDFEIPEGVNLVGVSSRESIIQGEITVNPGCLLENIKIINQDNSENEVYAVITTPAGDDSEMYKIKGCEIYAYQCGSGSAIAVYIDDSVELVVENSTVVADSNEGNGYTFMSNGGNCNVYHSNYYGKTEVFYDI